MAGNGICEHKGMESNDKKGVLAFSSNFHSSGGRTVPSDTKSCAREFPKTGFILGKGGDGKEFGDEVSLGDVCPFWIAFGFHPSLN